MCPGRAFLVALRTEYVLAGYSTAKSAGVFAETRGGAVVTLHFLGYLRSNDAYDLANIFHFHQIVHIQADPENLFQSSAE